MAGYMGQLGLACSWIPRREIEPQLLPPVYLVRLVLTAFTTDSPCLGGKGGGLTFRKGNQGFTLGKCVKPWWECRGFSKGQVQSLYPAGALDKFFFGL